MPFVRIDLFEGRTLEQKKALAKEVTEAVVRNTGAPSICCPCHHQRHARRNLLPSRGNAYQIKLA